MTAGMPDEPAGDMLEVALLYMAVTFFSVFILNIFIGVLGEQYALQKQHCVLIFRRRRAELCLRYMQRIHAQHFRACSGPEGHVLLVGCILACLTLQAHGEGLGWSQTSHGCLGRNCRAPRILGIWEVQYESRTLRGQESRI